MNRVIIESPYAGHGEDLELNERYLDGCLLDSLSRGEAPFASHGLYTRNGVLDDTIPDERRKGINAGFEWRQVAHFTAFYGDLGITKGMVMGLEHAIRESCPVVFRSLGGDWGPRRMDRWGEFSEREALRWLRDHRYIQWYGEDCESWMLHLAMMFGGYAGDVLSWNTKDCSSGTYIFYRHPVNPVVSGTHSVNLASVEKRLLSIAQEV